MEPTPAGWYPDHSSPQLRYWDGVRWTEHTAPGATTAPRVPEKVSVLAILISVIPMIGILGGAITLAKGKQPRTGATMIAVGVTSLVLVTMLRGLHGA